MDLEILEVLRMHRVWPSPPLIHSNHEIIVLAEKGRDGDISISLLRSVQVGLPPPQTMDAMIFSLLLPFGKAM